MLMELFPTHLPQPSPVYDEKDYGSQQKHAISHQGPDILELHGLQVIVALIVVHLAEFFCIRNRGLSETIATLLVVSDLFKAVFFIGGQIAGAGLQRFSMQGILQIDQRVEQVGNGYEQGDDGDQANQVPVSLGDAVVFLHDF